MARKSKKLKEIKDIITKELGDNEITVEEIIKNEKALEMFDDMYEEASMMTDVRIQASVYHTLESIVLLVILAMLAICNEFTQIYEFAKEHIML